MSRYERKAQSERKHGPNSISGASKAPVPPPANRPGWKGPGYVKKRPSRQSPSSVLNPTCTIQEQPLPIELQQLVLNIFRDTFPVSKDPEALKPTLHEINAALLQGDYERAFGREEYLEGYAVRWSPSRSLTYANALAVICDQIRGEEWTERLLSPGARTAKALCLGGGAAEAMAFAALLRHLRPDVAGKPDQCQPPRTGDAGSITNSSPALTLSPLSLHLVDTVDWASVVSRLQTGFTTAPTLSKYASATAQASNAALLSRQALCTKSTQANVFDLTFEDLSAMLGSDPAFIAFFLTLNELYSASIPKSTAFLRKLTLAAPKGSMLLILDSPGACAEVAMPGNAETLADDGKQLYQMNWLMDRVLLGKSQTGEKDAMAAADWEKIMDESSRQNKLAAKLSYPAGLENMKFQIHLFKRL